MLFKISYFERIKSDENFYKNSQNLRSFLSWRKIKSRKNCKSILIRKSGFKTKKWRKKVKIIQVLQIKH